MVDLRGDTSRLTPDPGRRSDLPRIGSSSLLLRPLSPKRDIYARLGVKEYWIHNPTGEHFTPVLQGLRPRLTIQPAAVVPLPSSRH